MPISQFQRDRTLPNKLKEFSKYFKPPNNLQTNALQTWVVIAHYKWTVGMVSGLFACVLGSWYISTPMECIVKSIDAHKEIPDYQEDICLSYPYTYTAPRDSYPTRRRVYALHYRWVHWALLFLIPLYSIPLLCRKYLEKSKIFLYLNGLKNMKLKDNNRNPTIAMIVDNYVTFSGWIYRNIILLHFVTLLVDVIAFAFVDIALQNRFARLFPLDYPFARWPQYFNDTISLAFPPFVECQIGPAMLLLLDMKETFGCRLTLMILYDKVFVLLWVWMVLLTLWSLFTLIYYMVLGVSRDCQKSLINIEGCKKDIRVCLDLLPVDSLLLLNCLKNILSTDEYKHTLRKISHTMSNLESLAKKENL